MTELEAGLEAALFAAGEAVSAARLSEALSVPREQVMMAAAALQSSYDFDRRGFMLLRIEDKFQLCSRPAYAEIVRQVTEQRRPPQLSPAALEVLTIAAYRQPVTRAFVEQMRGVDSSGTILGLIEKGFLAEAGRLDVPGRPMQFRTTALFLRSFGLASLADLPPLPALVENEQLSLDLEGEGLQQAEPRFSDDADSTPPPQESG